MHFLNCFKAIFRVSWATCRSYYGNLGPGVGDSRRAAGPSMYFSKSRNQLCRQAGRQTRDNYRTTGPASKRAGRQATRQAARQAARQTSNQAGRQGLTGDSHVQYNRAGRNPGQSKGVSSSGSAADLGQSSKQQRAGSRPRQASSQAGKQAGNQAARQPGRQATRQVRLTLRPSWAWDGIQGAQQHPAFISIK